MADGLAILFYEMIPSFDAACALLIIQKNEIYFLRREIRVIMMYYMQRRGSIINIEKLTLKDIFQVITTDCVLPASKQSAEPQPPVAVEETSKPSATSKDYLSQEEIENLLRASAKENRTIEVAQIIAIIQTLADIKIPRKSNKNPNEPVEYDGTKLATLLKRLKIQLALEPDYKLCAVKELLDLYCKENYYK